MPSMKLTQLAVDRLGPPKSGRVEYFDSVLPSFGLRIAATGSRSWIVFYRINGKQRRYTIGTVAKIPKVDEARKRAREILQEVARGADPAEAKAEAQAVKPPPREPDTVEQVADQFIERYARLHNRAWAEQRRTLQNHIVSRWGERDIATITRREIIELMDDLADKGFTVAPRRVLATVRVMFRWAVERDIISASPVVNIQPPGKEVERDRVLSDDELLRVWNAAETLGPIGGGFIRLLALLGQRRDEVATMQWRDIDFERPVYEDRGGQQVKVGTEAVWTLPRARTKGDRQHEVPLPPLAVEILTSLPRFERGGYVFTTTRGEKPISGYSKLKAKLDKASGIETDWRLHDLRRTAGTGMASLGIAPGTISRVLNHKEGGVTKIYNRYGYLPEKRHALATWARKVESLVRPAQGNVVDLAKTAERQ